MTSLPSIAKRIADELNVQEQQVSAAVGLLQSVLGFICIYGSNWLVKKYSQSRGEDYTLF